MFFYFICFASPAEVISRCKPMPDPGSACLGAGHSKLPSSPRERRRSRISCNSSAYCWFKRIPIRCTNPVVKPSARKRRLRSQSGWFYCCLLTVAMVSALAITSGSSWGSTDGPSVFSKRATGTFLILEKHVWTKCEWFLWFYCRLKLLNWLKKSQFEPNRFHSS